LKHMKFDLGILYPKKKCPKCGTEMILSGKIKYRGKMRKVYHCPKCKYREIEKG